MGCCWAFDQISRSARSSMTSGVEAERKGAHRPGAGQNRIGEDDRHSGEPGLAGGDCC